MEPKARRVIYIRIAVTRGKAFRGLRARPTQTGEEGSKLVISGKEQRWIQPFSENEGAFQL